MAETPKPPAHVASQSTHVCTLAAFGFEHGGVWIWRFDKAQFLDDDDTRREFDNFALAGQVIGTIAVDLDGRERRWALADLPGELVQQRFYIGTRGSLVGAINDLAFGVVRGGLHAPAHGEAIGLLAVHGKRHRLRRLAECNRQNSCCERIERACVAGLLRFEHTFCRAERLRRGYSKRLIEN